MEPAETDTKRSEWEDILRDFEASGLTKVAYAEHKGLSIHKLRYWYSSIVNGKSGGHFGKFPYIVTKYPKTLIKSLDEVKDSLILAIAKNELPPLINKILSTQECLNCESTSLENTSPGKVTYKCPDCDYIHFLPLRKSNALSAIGSSAYMGSGTLIYLSIETLKETLKGDDSDGSDHDDSTSD